MTVRKKRRVYFLIFLSLLITEVFIAVFVHDSFVRPYLGDVLAVGVVFYFIKIFFCDRIPILPLYVFIFAVVIEVLPLIEFFHKIGTEHKILGIILGSTFDWKDVICYAVGCSIISVVDLISNKKGIVQR